MAKRPHKPRRKGFKRSGREWEESVAGHIGRIVDNTKVIDLIDATVPLGVAYVGYKVGGWGGALIGLVSLKLTNSPNIVAGGAGLVGLIGLGLASQPPILDWIEERFKMPTPTDHLPLPGSDPMPDPENPEKTIEKERYLKPESIPYYPWYKCKEGYTFKTITGFQVCIRNDLVP